MGLDGGGGDELEGVCCSGDEGFGVLIGFLGVEELWQGLDLSMYLV